MTDYAIYKGDDILFVGTIKECAEYLGIEEKLAKHYTYASYQKRIPKDSKKIILVKVEE